MGFSFCWSFFLTDCRSDGISFYRDFVLLGFRSDGFLFYWAEAVQSDQNNKSRPTIYTHRVVDDNRQPGRGGQTQDEHADSQPVDVHESVRIRRGGLVVVENGAVQGNDDGDDLAAENGHVADHHEPIGFDDRAADGLVTSTILLKVAAELTSVTDTPYGPEMSAGMGFRTGKGKPTGILQEWEYDPTWEWETHGNPTGMGIWLQPGNGKPMGIPREWEYDSNLGMGTGRSGNARGRESVDCPELESYSHSRGIFLGMEI